MITFDDFSKLKIKIGTIVEVSKIPDTTKLLKIIVDFDNESRQIISGIAEYYPDYTSLLGKQVPVLVNLEYKVFRGHESQGMILMVDADKGVVQLTPDETVKNGSIVR